MAYASSLDAIGCFGSTVADTGILLHAIAGHDRFDATSSKQVRVLHHVWYIYCMLSNFSLLAIGC
jgi:Asp-tRNA(Asn)/Glu-tRNA(Gln) amidotransferase A subunit family amidase